MKHVLMIFLMVAITSCNSIKRDKAKVNEYLSFDTLTNELSFYTSKVNGELILFNDKAVKTLQNVDKIVDKRVRDSLLSNSVNDLTEVIKKDSDFYYAYLNKAALLRGLCKYEESIETLQELLKRQKYPEATFIIGITYEKLGNKELANKKYKEALGDYNKRLNSPLATSQDDINKQILLILIEGKEKVLKDINQKIKKDPENTSLLIDKNIIEEFDKEDFFKSF